MSAGVSRYTHRRFALALGAMLYCAVQWKYAARLGPQTIFSSSRTTDRADFADMLSNLAKATDRACRADPSSRLLFSDGDFALPYMQISGDRVGGCVVIRSTNVTRFSQLEIDDCHAVFLREHAPSDRSTMQINDLPTGPLIETERWMSHDGAFGFAFYRHPCMADEDGGILPK